MYQNDHITNSTTTSFRISSSLLERMDYYCRSEDITRIMKVRKRHVFHGTDCSRKGISVTLSAADQWIKTCILDDRSIFSPHPLWTRSLAQEVRHAFVDHPDTGADDFMTKLIRQMKQASQGAQHLMSEMLWALLLFPSNMKARTKRRQIMDLWALGGEQLHANDPSLTDKVLQGIGSGGPGFNNYRPSEMTFLIEVIGDLKHRDIADRRTLLTDYNAFICWIDGVSREGSRQFRHMLRFFTFPDRVERISSNNDRRSILIAFDAAAARQVQQMTDRQLDEALLALREKLQSENPAQTLDFYMPGLKERWRKDRKVKTPEGEITVNVPVDQEEEGDLIISNAKAPEVRQSIQVRAKLAEIGATMGFRIWLPRNDRARVREVVVENPKAKKCVCFLTISLKAYVLVRQQMLSAKSQRLACTPIYKTKFAVRRTLSRLGTM
jgi:hypothetical protein